MNVENLRKVKELILAEPRRLNMRDWLATGTTKQLRAAGHDAPSCGTIGCIAGWGATLFHLEQDQESRRESSLASTMMVMICNQYTSLDMEAANAAQV